MFVSTEQWAHWEISSAQAERPLGRQGGCVSFIGGNLALLLTWINVAF
jgi:hypothetical protein